MFHQRVVVAIITLAVSLRSISILISAATLCVCLLILWRTERLGRDVHIAIQDQARGIQVVTDKAKALADDDGE